MASDYCLNLIVKKQDASNLFVKSETYICVLTEEICKGAYKDYNIDIMPFKLKENPYCARRNKPIEIKNWKR